MNERTEEKRIIAIDSQILDNIDACLMKWNLYNLQNWRGKQKSKAFSKGTLVHEMLKQYYLMKIDGQKWDECRKGAIEYGNLKSIELTIDLVEQQDCFRACDEYFQYYRGESWIPLAVEEPFSYKFYEDDEMIILYEGIVDLRVQTDADENHPVDHKTTSRNTMIHPLKNQFIGYCRAHNASRMTINSIGFQKTLPMDEKYQRHMKSYDKNRQEEWAEDIVHKIKMAVLHHDMGIFPHNFHSCDGKYGPCMFTEVCRTVKDAREWKLKTEFEKVEESWDCLRRDD